MPRKPLSITDVRQALHSALGTLRPKPKNIADSTNLRLFLRKSETKQSLASRLNTRGYKIFDIQISRANTIGELIYTTPATADYIETRVIRILIQILNDQTIDKDSKINLNAAQAEQLAASLNTEFAFQGNDRILAGGVRQIRKSARVIAYVSMLLTNSQLFARVLKLVKQAAKEIAGTAFSAEDDWTQKGVDSLTLKQTIEIAIYKEFHVKPIIVKANLEANPKIKNAAQYITSLL